MKRHRANGPEYPSASPLRDRKLDDRANGFTLIEVSAAAAILTVAMSIALTGFTWLAAEQRSLDRRLRAELEVAYTLERLAGRSWETLVAGRFKAKRAGGEAPVELTSPWVEAMPGAELWVEIVDEPGPPAAKRLTASVLHPGRSGEVESLARLTTWAYARGDEPQERRP